MAEVISIEKSVQHNNGDSWELENYPPFAQKDNAEEWLGVSEISLERAKELAFQLAGNEAYDYEDEINDAEDLYELQDVLDNFKYYQRDNTYNSSWWGGVVDFGVLTEDGEGYGTGLVLLRMHRGGDPRGNYYDMRAFELDSFIEEFPPYLSRLTYYIKTDEGDLTLDTEDMEGYSLMVVEDETGTFEQDDYVKIDEVEDAFDMNGNSFFSFGGGVAVGSLIGAYIGYKVGRARGKRKGGTFDTEKKIYRKVKNKFAGGGGVESPSEEDARKELEKLKSQGKITLSIGNHGLIFMQIVNTGNAMVSSFKRSYQSYLEALKYYYRATYRFAGGGGVEKNNGRYQIKGASHYDSKLDDVLYYSTNNKNEIGKLVERALGESHNRRFGDSKSVTHIYVYDTINDEEVYNYAGGGGVGESVDGLKTFRAKADIEWVDLDGNDDSIIINEYIKATNEEEAKQIFISKIESKIQKRRRDWDFESIDINLVEDNTYAKGGGVEEDIYYGVVDHNNNLVFQSQNEREAKQVSSSYAGSIVKKYKGKGKIHKYAVGGNVQSEITNINNRIYNLNELRSVSSNKDDIAYLTQQINGLEREKENLLNPKPIERKKLFGLFGEGGGIDDLIKG